MHFVSTVCSGVHLCPVQVCVGFKYFYSWRRLRGANHVGVDVRQGGPCVCCSCVMRDVLGRPEGESHVSGPDERGLCAD